MILIYLGALVLLLSYLYFLSMDLAFTVSSWDDLVGVPLPHLPLQLAPSGLTSAAHQSTAFTDSLLLVGPVLWRQGSHSAVQATTSILLANLFPE